MPVASIRRVPAVSSRRPASKEHVRPASKEGVRPDLKEDDATTTRPPGADAVDALEPTRAARGAAEKHTMRRV